MAGVSLVIVELIGEDGTRVSLTVTGYQFPDISGSGPQDWDANWLNVAGTVRLPDGRRHAFVEPCLTTWEADGLASWLLSAAESRTPGQDGRRPDLTFTEPCLGFVAGVEGDTVRLRVYLSLEAEPPFVVGGRPGIHQNHVPLALSRAAVDRAAHDLIAELRAYPVRGRSGP